MAVLKVIEVLSNSPKSFEDAIERAVKKADKTLKNIRSVNVENMSATVEGGKLKDVFANLVPLFIIALLIQAAAFIGLKKKNLV